MNIEELNSQDKLEEIESEFEIFIRDMKTAINELREELKSEFKPIEPIGCYRIKPERGTPYLWVDDESKIGETEWSGHRVDFKRYNHGNCYPLSMRTHLENAIECREVLMADENVVLGYECEMDLEYYGISIFQEHSKGTFKLFRFFSSDRRLRYNFKTSGTRDNFLNKYYDKLISMFLCGWL